jgi:hypothetical protein
MTLSFTFIYKTSYLNEEVNCTEPSPSLSVPWPHLHQTSKVISLILFKNHPPPACGTLATNPFSGLYHHLYQKWLTSSQTYRSNTLWVLIGCSLTFWLLNQWRYNQVQKLMLDRYLLNFSLGLCGMILFSEF